MAIQETILKKLYIKTYEDMIALPVYKMAKANTSQNVETEIEKIISLKTDLAEFGVDGASLQGFKENYGDKFENNIKSNAYSLKKSNITKFEKEAEKHTEEIEGNPHKHIYYYLYLRNRLRAIEEQLQKLNLRPIIGINDEVAFVEIKQP